MAMEPPPPSLSSTTVASTVIPAATTHVPPSSYPESLESSPEFRTTEAYDDLPTAAVSSKLRLMCSYGGHILPRPHDKSLSYIGGDTRIVVVDRNSTLSSLITRLSNTLLNNNNRSFTLKYQLPNEDLDSLISVTTDEDLDNMIEEYDRTINTTKSSRLRLFLFTSKPEATQSMGQILESSVKSDDWFLDALNRSFSDPDRLRVCSDQNGNKDDDGSFKSVKQQPPPPSQQDVQNVAESPMLDTSSSFGSASSSPSLVNLPPIRVHVEDQKVGIEDQFARFTVGSKKQELPEDGFAAITSSSPPMPVTISLPAAPANVSSEFNTRVVSDDERSDHGVQAGCRKPPTPHSQPPQQRHHVKSNSGGPEPPSPNSLSSDNSVNNPVFHQRSSVCQESMTQMPSGSTVVAGNGMINPSDQNTFLSQSQNQNQEPGYILHPQQSAQSQQFIHSAAQPQYIHHHPSNGHPVQAYVVYPSQQHQQSFQRHPGQLYYVTSPVPPPPFNMQQSGSVSEAPGSLPSNHPQAPPNNTMMAQPSNNNLRSVAPGGKPESGVYPTELGIGGAQVVHQIPTNQQQFMGYSQIHHPPQSGSSGIPNYGYEYADNAHKQVYYTLPMGHTQYQTMTGPPPAMVLPDGSSSVKPPAENMSQQIRNSPPL